MFVCVRNGVTNTFETFPKGIFHIAAMAAIRFNSQMKVISFVKVK